MNRNEPNSIAESRAVDAEFIEMNQVGVGHKSDGPARTANAQCAAIIFC